jgi:hypothetical protein
MLPDHPFLVWQCVKIESIQTNCEEENFTEDLGEVGYSPSFKIKGHNAMCDFFTSKVVTHEICEEDRREWEKLCQEGEVACFSAYYDGEIKERDGAIAQHTSWTIDRIKSKKGRWSYFCEPGWKDCGE